MAKPLNIKDYQKLLNLSDYTKGLSGKRFTDCTTIYTTLSAIDLRSYIGRFNTIIAVSNPTITEETDMQDLVNDISADLALAKSLITPSDPIVSAPASVMRGQLSTLQSIAQTAKKEITNSLKHPRTSKIKGAIKDAEKGINKVTSAYKKFTGPAEGIFKAVSNAGEDGFGSFFGRGRK